MNPRPKTQPRLRGEGNGQAKLKAREVRVIKKLLLKGWTIWQLAQTYRVSHTAIWMIQKRRTWGWL